MCEENVPYYLLATQSFSQYPLSWKLRQRVVTLNLPINSSFMSLIKWSHSDDLLLLIRVLSLSNLLPLPASFFFF